MIHKHLAVIGRIDDDGDDSVILYQNLSIEDAEATFRKALPAQREYVAPGAEVYVNHVLTSDSPITIERDYA